MLAVVDNQLAAITPFLAPIERYTIDAVGGFIRVYADGRPIESGVTYYRMNNQRRSTINPRTGEYAIEGNRPTRFRAVFGGQHLDLEVWP